MKIIVGLGNPGEQYKNTRHNVGWIFLDSLVDNKNWKVNKKFNALTYKDGDILFIKPLTFMNNSGQSVYKALDYYGLIQKRLGIFKKKDEDLSDCLTVIQDDLDIDFGNYKIATDSGSAGHKGINSIMTYLKTKKFKRLRIGVKNELLRTKIPAEKFVLQSFNKKELEEMKILAKTLSQVATE